jgi:hypothetical protein
MKLTGKCKEDFEKWWYSKFNPSIDGETHHFMVMIGDKFNALTDSMQYGVYVDFFDSVGIDIVDNIDSCANDFRYLSKVDFKCIDAHNTRPEARTAAIEKADEIHNKTFKTI